MYLRMHGKQNCFPSFCWYQPVGQTRQSFPINNGVSEYLPCWHFSHSVPAIFFFPAEHTSQVMPSLLNFPIVQLLQLVRPASGANLLSSHVLHWVARLNVPVYCPAVHLVQASSSVTAQVKDVAEWSDPFSSRLALFVNFDPGLQHRTRECGDREIENRFFAWCQSALHSNLLKAVLLWNTVNEKGLE